MAKMGNSKESADNLLDIIKQMIEDDNKRLIISTTVPKVEYDPRGAIVCFGVEQSTGDAVRPSVCMGFRRGIWRLLFLSIERSTKRLRLY